MPFILSINILLSLAAFLLVHICWNRPNIISMFLIFGGLLSIPFCLSALYYTHIFTPPFWWIILRSYACYDFMYAAIAFPIAIIWRREISSFVLSPILLCIALQFLPFLKPIVRPLAPIYNSQWKDNICLQSTPSTCGPACLATLLRAQGIADEEANIARQCFSSASGTEIWYLLRYAKTKGFQYNFYTVKTVQDLRPSAIVGVRIGAIGHFIVLLDVSPTQIVVGDPLDGLLTLTPEDFQKKYLLAGMLLQLQRVPDAS